MKITWSRVLGVALVAIIVLALGALEVVNDRVAAERVRPVLGPSLPAVETWPDQFGAVQLTDMPAPYELGLFRAWRTACRRLSGVNGLESTGTRDAARNPA